MMIILIEMDIKKVTEKQPAFYVAFFLTKCKKMEEVKAKAPETIAKHILLMDRAFLDKLEEQVSTMAVLTSREGAEEFVKGDRFVLKGVVSN